MMTHAADAGSFHLRGFVYMHSRLMTLLRFGGGGQPNLIAFRYARTSMPA